MVLNVIEMTESGFLRQRVASGQLVGRDELLYDVLEMWRQVVEITVKDDYWSLIMLTRVVCVFGRLEAPPVSTFKSMLCS